MADALGYVSNKTLHKNLGVPFVMNEKRNMRARHLNRQNQPLSDYFVARNGRNCLSEQNFYLGSSTQAVYK